MKVEINTNLPPDAHPASLGDDPPPNLSSAMARAYEVWGRAHDAARELDAQADGLRPKLPAGAPKMTPVQRLQFDQREAAWRAQMNAHKAELAEALRPKFESAFVAFDSAVEKSRSESATLRGQLRSSLVKAKPDPVLQQRVFDMLGKKPTIAKLNEAIDTGDPDVISTILGTSPFLLGVTQEQQTTMYDKAASKYQPELVKKIDENDKAVVRAERALVLFRDETASYMRKWRSPAQDVIEGARNV
ncbi:MAG: hypothetical protein AAFX75_14590 [Pseudomonadota bacterium]